MFALFLEALLAFLLALLVLDILLAFLLVLLVLDALLAFLEALDVLLVLLELEVLEVVFFAIMIPLFCVAHRHLYPHGFLVAVLLWCFSIKILVDNCGKFFCKYQ